MTPKLLLAAAAALAVAFGLAVPPPGRDEASASSHLPTLEAGRP